MKSFTALFGDSWAVFLLVTHAIFAICTVATTTHLVVWLRSSKSGNKNRLESVRRFSALAFLFFSATFVLGLVIYPTYKVKVRAGYFENTELLQQNIEGGESTGLVHSNRQATKPDANTLRDRARHGKALAQLFDIKEHLAFLGWICMALCFVSCRYWEPGSQPSLMKSWIYTLALFACASTWLAGVVGLVVSANRSIAAL